MGKKKSTVLMVLLTIVIVILCAITVVPSFAVPNTVKIWNPVVSMYDLGTDLNGGYYAYYYPTGVISEVEYKNLEPADQDSYRSYKGLYVNSDPEMGLWVKGEDNVYTISPEFTANFAKATNEIRARYAAKGYSDYRVSVVDDYALAIYVPSSESSKNQSGFQSAYNTFGQFAKTGALEIKLGDALVEERQEYEVDKIIKEFSVYKQNEVAFLQITFTSVGKEMIKEYKETGATSESGDLLKIMIGDEEALTIEATDNYITSRNVVRIGMQYEEEEHAVETVAILFNSALKNGGFDIEFNMVSNSEIRTYSAVYGENTLTLVYIALALVLVGLMAYTVWQMGGFGVACAYSTVSYLIVVAICYAFISAGVFEIGLGSILIFLLGLVLVNVLNIRIYDAIKHEFELGKTVESSVKGGYKKTLMSVIDVYAVAVLGAVALLIALSGVYTFALQALICLITAAFCNLLWTRVISAMLLSASKNKYHYFRFVRQEDDDDE